MLTQHSIGPIARAFWTLFAAAGTLLAAVGALGAGDTIPERRDVLCEKLGRPPGCAIHFSGRWDATVLLTMDENVDEPDHPAAFPVAGGTVTVLVGDVSVAGVYSPLDEIEEVGDYLYAELYKTPPCLTPSCTRLGTYPGPSEAELAQLTSDKLRLQIGSSEMSSELAFRLDTDGIPTVTSVRSLVVTNNAGNTGATTARVEVILRAAH